MSENPGRHYDDCDADIREFLDAVADTFLDRLGPRLTGVWLHGSLAFGCFNRHLSDLDVLIAVEDPLDESEAQVLALGCVDHSDARPILGEIELSVVLARNLDPFVHPTPFELHYGENFRDKIREGQFTRPEHRVDPDLAAHCTVAREVGVTLRGLAPRDVIGPVPWDAYVESVLLDFDWISSEGHVVESPIYGVLNACRTLHLLTEGEGTVAGKEDAARWAIRRFPKPQRDLAEKALVAYRDPRRLLPAERRTAGLTWDRDALLRFREWAETEVARLR